MLANQPRRSVRSLAGLAIVVMCPPVSLALAGRLTAAAMNLCVCAMAVWGQGAQVGLWLMAVLHAAYVLQRAAALAHGSTQAVGRGSPVSHQRTAPRLRR